MNESSYINNENEVTILTQEQPYPTTPNSKLSNNNSNKPLSANNSPTPRSLSPLRRKQHHQQQHFAGLSSKDSSRGTPTNSATASSASLDEFKLLQRNFADSLLNFNSLQNENKRLEHELNLKKAQLKSQLEKLQFYEQSLKELEIDSLHKQEILSKQIEMYKGMVDSLQTKVFELSQELEKKLLMQDQTNDVEEYDAELVKKYEKLVRDYKILDSQFEVERNSKLVLIDQIEFLSHKNEDLVKQIESPSTEDAIDDYLVDLTDHATHTMHELTDEEDEYTEDSIISPGLNIGTSAQSSPIKQHKQPYDESNSSVKVEPNFQFPPSPEKDCKEPKRQSLPSELTRKRTLGVESSEFVLSPFKLAPSNVSASEDTGVFPDTHVVKRYSATKPTHSRYNSHDILPVKVEFEKETGSVRSTSVPEKVLRNQLICEIIQENEECAKKNHRNGTLSALNGYDGEIDEFSKNFSEGSSSKRSSYMTGDENKTRQELTKLKFELQSLRLHNEKLLSFIGFELQKQKNNIKKLSKKQSQRTLGGNSRPIEYSDAKLIEKSRDMLINKKRVLRSVSINTGFTDRFTKDPINTLGLVGSASSPAGEGSNEKGFVDFESLTSSSNPLNDKMIKKFASQVFNNTPALYEFDLDSDFENTGNWEIEEEEEEEEEEELSSSSDEELGVFNQIKQLVIGGQRMKDKKLKKKRGSNGNGNDHLVDDTLKFKFMTIALGIVIIGLKLTPQNTAAVIPNK
ncbi:hypothetical protein Cantr_00967 [Candida viswanathii]|uniref:Uncharacterized protein n=1 Tax=Candida viswanathii TaxID=5486 RepID=A0A367YHB3_9ASCO|nr:hypothetical protein Cantr_00967 [Candida viswanathii]